MKNKKGFSAPEIIILIVAIGAVFIGATIKFSFAFTDNADEVYEMEVAAILERAESYGEKNLELFAETDRYPVSVKELIREGYLLADPEADYKDPRNDNKTLNDLKIILEHNNGEVSASLAK